MEGKSKKFLSKSGSTGVLKLIDYLTLKLIVMLRKMLFCAGLFCSSFGAVNAQIINLEDLTLYPDSFWNGSDGTGGFYTGTYAYFPNNFVDYGGGFTAWDGFAFSNKLNDTTQDFSNMYSCYAGQLPVNSSIFGVSYNPMNFADYTIIPTEVSFSVPALPLSILVNNSAYAALTIKNGDMFCKAFGGVTGNDPDWFRLDIIGINNSIVTDTVHYYLADYRFVDNLQDYIIKDWTTVDLSTLGQVTKIAFSLASSDTGSFGMNTPAYFCFDDISCTFLTSISENTAQASVLFPNPTYGKVYANTMISDIKIMTITGKEVYSDKGELNGFDVSGFPKGIYIVKMNVEGKELFQKLVVK